MLARDTRENIPPGIHGERRRCADNESLTSTCRRGLGSRCYLRDARPRRTVQFSWKRSPTLPPHPAFVVPSSDSWNRKINFLSSEIPKFRPVFRQEIRLPSAASFTPFVPFPGRVDCSKTPRRERGRLMTSRDSARQARIMYFEERAKGEKGARHPIGQTADSLKFVRSCCHYAYSENGTLGSLRLSPIERILPLTGPREWKSRTDLDSPFLSFLCFCSSGTLQRGNFVPDRFRDSFDRQRVK